MVEIRRAFVLGQADLDGAVSDKVITARANGYIDFAIDFEANGIGKWIVKVPVKPTCAKVDFVVVLDATGDPWVKDGGDHSISFPLDQTVVCASIKTGEEPKLSAPYNIGYELYVKYPKKTKNDILKSVEMLTNEEIDVMSKYIENGGNIEDFKKFKFEKIKE